MFPIRLTFNTISRAGLIRIMIACAILAVISVSAMVALITVLASHAVHFEKGWLDTAFSWTVGIVTGIGGWFMLPVFTVLIGGIFQEKVIYRVEKAFYPDISPAGGPKLWPDFFFDIKFTLKALFLNLLVLPLYLFGIGFIASVVLNSYLLGREFFETAAGYHLGKTGAKVLGDKNRRAVYTGGFIITMMTLTPLLNMFVPIIAVVWMIHVYHGIANRN